VVVGLNRFEETEPSPLVEGMAEGFASIERIEAETEVAQIAALRAWRDRRDGTAARAALGALRRAVENGDNLVPPSIDAARAGVTTGEWADALRGVFGEYRAPTGVGGQIRQGEDDGDALRRVREKVAEAVGRLGVSRVRMLVAKPGLDGHSNAAEQVAVRARDAGFEVIYQGIRLTAAEIARAAADEDVHVIGLSILSGAHRLLVPDVLDRLRGEGVDPERVPVIVGGIIPDQDVHELIEAGVAKVFTPRDHDLTRIIGEIADLLG
jgi:(2R)-ethylmalonyl-CoA mutase